MKNRFRLFLLLTLFILFSGCLKENAYKGNWTRKAEFYDGEFRYQATSFALAQKGYLGLGEVEGRVYSDFWEYDPETDKWQRKKDFPGLKRYGAVSFVIGNNAYVGLGYSAAESRNLTDFWKYDCLSDEWTEVTSVDVPSMLYNGAFAIANKGYVVKDGEILVYEPQTNSWTVKREYEPVGASGIVFAFSIKGKGYFGGLDKAYEYNPTTNELTEIASFPFSSSTTYYKLINFAQGNYGYVLDSRTLFSYNPATNTWKTASLAPFYNSMGYCVADNRIFFVFCNNPEGTAKAVWEYIINPQ
ncbi:MAG: hypothetical protein LBM67_01595 [Lentimicrobiaceae bacterium]|jgi:N-acetylneuraminic acid mutarotase|nr:hypothetical protein [Lentimicrobiaceae bacterium]